MEKPGGWRGWLDGLEDRSLDGGDRRFRERVVWRVLDKAGICPGCTVLDLGAGTGLLSVKLSGMVGPSGTVFCLDPDPGCVSALEELRSSGGLGNMEPVQGTVEQLPFDGETMDAVVCRSVLVYTADLGQSVRRIKDVLKPGGRISVFEPLLGELRWRIDTPGGCEEFQAMEQVLKEERPNVSMDRRGVREAFSGCFRDCRSLVVHLELKMAGRKADDIHMEYLYDLPGELGALQVLRRRFSRERIIAVTGEFASAASEGKVTGILPCIFVWGVREP